MAGMSTYLENKVIDVFLRGVAHTAPSSDVFLTIHEEDPTDAGTADAGIGRVAATIAAPSAGVATNSSPVTFTDVDEGDYRHASAWDAVSGGNMLYSGPLRKVRVAEDGDTVTFAAGKITFTNT